MISTKEKICIIGAGTYGCYLANALTEKYPQCEIYLFEVGNNQIRSEEEVGFLSKLSNNQYKAASDGRYFGLGGTSAKWGGQLLFFSDHDFGNAKEMKEVVDCNNKYKNAVLKKFFANVPEIKDEKVSENLYIRNGVWLKFQHRNMFNYFNIAAKKNIKIIAGTRVVKINHLNKTVTSVTLKTKDGIEEFNAVRYYLTAGALESLRLLEVSGISDMQTGSSGFSDHVSLRCFEILSPSAKIGSQDLQFKFINGSLITSRLTGEIDNTSFYAHPIFNESFIFFQFLKKMIFKGAFSFNMLLPAIKQFGSIFPFAYNFLFKKKLFIYGSWFLNIDIELAQSKNFICLSEESDKFHEKGLEINFSVNNDTIDKLLIAKNEVKKFLDANDIKFRELNEDVSTLKLEDIYHPYALFRYKENDTFYQVYNPLSNLFLFNTGLLKRSGPINPTASLFCLIEYHVNESV